MATEIERKFLVRDDGWRAETMGAGTPIRQGYLSRPPHPEVRVRIAGDRGFLTVKGRGGLVRSEHEWEIPRIDAEEVLEQCLPSVIAKTRHRIPSDDVVWEVDVFEGECAGLVLAEVELAVPDQPVELPAWVGTEVTGDKRYSNAQLSVAGCP